MQSSCCSLEGSADGSGKGERLVCIQGHYQSEKNQMLTSGGIRKDISSSNKIRWHFARTQWDSSEAFCMFLPELLVPPWWWDLHNQSCMVREESFKLWRAIQRLRWTETMWLDWEILFSLVCLNHIKRFITVADDCWRERGNRKREQEFFNLKDADGIRVSDYKDKNGKIKVGS